MLNTSKFSNIHSILYYLNKYCSGDIRKALNVYVFITNSIKNSSFFLPYKNNLTYNCNSPKAQIKLMIKLQQSSLKT